MMPGMHHHGSHRGNVRADSTMAGGGGPGDRHNQPMRTGDQSVRIEYRRVYQRETVAIRGDKVGSEGRGSGVVVVGGRSARTTDG